MGTNIVQWNIKGFCTHYADLRTLLSHTNAVVMCIQESRLPHPLPSPPRGFQMYHKPGPPGRDNMDYGGVCTIVRSCVSHTEINLHTELQAVAIRCHLNRLYTVCSLYLPPRTPVSITQLHDLIQQLPPPFLILGDLNARSPLWGDYTTTARGCLIENLLNRDDLGLLNDGSPTYFCSGNSSFTCIDLSIASAEATVDFEWSVSEDLYNSDHFPITISIPDITAIATTIRYKYDKANWGSFKRAALCSSDVEEFSSVDEALQHFTSMVQAAASAAIPQTSGVLRTRTVPWWNEELKTAHKDKTRAMRRYKRTRLVQDKIVLQRTRAKFRYLQRTSRANSWKEYTSSINEHTPINKVWLRVKKIQGRYVPPPRPVLVEGDDYVMEPAAVANKLAETLSEISAGPQCRHFLQLKRRCESNPVHFLEDDGSSYNMALTRAELMNALRSSFNTAAGEDCIHYSMIKNLPDVSVAYLLSLYNRIWSTGQFPASWRVARVIPFLKAGKDPHQPMNYRPIALTSCLCKLLERIVNNRLNWYLEERNLLHQSQYGFRKCRSTAEALVRLDSYIKIAFARKEHVVAVFFDIEKAYDTTWRYHILKTLQGAGLTVPFHDSFRTSFMTDLCE